MSDLVCICIPTYPRKSQKRRSMIKMQADSCQKSIEYMLKNEWYNDEYYEDALYRAVIVAALKLAFFRKHPIICRVWLFRVICGVWYEISSLIFYETGKLYTDFSGKVFQKFGRTKVFNVD